jgi:ribosomal protein S17
MAEETKKPETTAASRGNRKERLGKVISNKMTKTIVVEDRRCRVD